MAIDGIRNPSLQHHPLGQNFNSPSHPLHTHLNILPIYRIPSEHTSKTNCMRLMSFWSWQPHQPHLYFASTCFLHHLSLSQANLHYCLIEDLNLGLPKPPYLIGVQTVSQSVRWYLNSSPSPPHIMFRCIRSFFLGYLPWSGKQGHEISRQTWQGAF